MSEQKTGLGRFLAKIGDFFEGLFNAAAKTYNDQSDEIQTAFVQGSEILDIINANVKAAPDFLMNLITARFPGLDKEHLSEGLTKVEKVLNIADDIQDKTLEDTLKNLQAYLDKQEGSDWAGITGLAAKTLAFFFAPAGTKWAIFESLMEYVYQKFIKKD